MDMVYVLNKDGKPLMATARGGRVRYLLKEKKARVVSRTRQNEYRRCCRQGERLLRVLRTSGDPQQGIASLDEEACRFPEAASQLRPAQEAPASCEGCGDRHRRGFYREIAPRLREARCVSLHPQQGGSVQ